MLTPVPLHAFLLISYTEKRWPATHEKFSTMTAQLSRPRFAAISFCLTICCFLFVCLTIAVWLIPVDVVKLRAYDAAPPEPFAQFEAVGRAEALWWFFRIVAVLGTIATGYALYYRIETAQFIAGLIDDVLIMLNPKAGSDTRLLRHRAVLMIRCFSIIAMVTLACFHQVHGINQQTKDWAYYELADGDATLPNISESNRAVIRYLRAATPDDSRIFVVSDQKLFFLSYYLLPRQIVHRMHPSAEHLIPRKNQERQLAAYRLSDLPDDLLAKQRPDFVLEYFEGSEYVQPERAMEDSGFLKFMRQLQKDSDYVPSYTVVLRPWTEALQ